MDRIRRLNYFFNGIFLKLRLIIVDLKHVYHETPGKKNFCSF